MTGAAALDIGDLRGGCIPIVNVGNEAGAFREKRLERQKQFLASRKARHDVALAEFDQAMDALAEDCQREVEAATERIKRDLEASTVDCNAILEPLEPPPLPPKAEGEEEEEDEAKLLDELEDLPMDGTIDPAKAKAVAAENAARKALRTLGERTEGEVRGILSALEAPRESFVLGGGSRAPLFLEAATLLRRRRIEEFAGPSGELARIDDLRKSSVEELLKTLVEAARHTHLYVLKRCTTHHIRP